MICSPLQSSWLRVAETHPDSSVISKLEMYIKNDYVDSVYESCEYLKPYYTGQSVMDDLCGAWNSRTCTGQRWFEWIGSMSNGFIPFEIEYKYELNLNEYPNMTLYENSAEDCRQLSVSALLTSIIVY